jgi:peptidoglycan/xylan/chitin deacetylase (PgdA/CDA1 family)
MSLTHVMSKSRGPRNLLKRAMAILNRFGISAHRFQRRLLRYSAVMRKHGCVPTFAITAVTLKRHPRLVQQLSREGIEFAVHGYVHTDYKMLSADEQKQHFQRAIGVFNDCRIPFVGFRAPFLRANGSTAGTLADLGFSYDSSRVIRWDVFDETEYASRPRRAYRRLVDFYRPLDSRRYLALPRFSDGLVEIPVSIPDDEAMVDRLGITDEARITDIWRAILRRTHERGEIFTVQLHPERVSLCEPAVTKVLEEARELAPPVWVATLAEIAQWWKERSRFVFDISPGEGGGYRVLARCSERATVLLKNCRAEAASQEWAEGWKSIGPRQFLLRSPARPVIGVAPDTSQAAVDFLVSEGFLVERSARRSDYGLYLADLVKFGEADEKALVARVQSADAPLLRFWRWPSDARSALSVTGDIDSITLTDFALRVLENWRYRGR